MEIRIAYGRRGLAFTLPDALDASVIEPRYVPGLVDVSGSFADALDFPIGAPSLTETVRRGDRVGVVFSDITRPVPNRQILSALLPRLHRTECREIVLFNALGTHRRNSDAELREMLGAEIVDEYRIVQNDSHAEATQVRIGRARRGHDIWLNREFAECDLKILTGFIEPHFFAGFSGGGKAIMPGMAGLSTVLQNHDATMIAHPQATWGVTHGNPIWEEVREVALACGRTFLVNVAMNRDRQITGIFAGELERAHQQGCDFVKESAMAPVDALFDVVITSNSGYPLDMNLYQSVKGLSAAAQIVRPGGAIIVASECSEGIPEHGLYGRLLAEASDPASLLARIMAHGSLVQDQWQAQIQAQIQMKADVFLHTRGLSHEQIRGALLQPCSDIAETVLQRVGGEKRARVAVLPEGPQTVPYLRGV